MHDVEYEASIDAVIVANNCAPMMLSLPSRLCPYIDETVKFDDDPIRASLASVNICFDETLMAERFHDRLLQSKYAASIGSTSAENPQDPHVCELFGLNPSDSDRHEYWYTPDDMINPQRSVSATHASKPKGINKEHIMKIWRVSEDEDRRTLEVNTQLNMQDSKSNLSRDLSTNDRMLRYKRINSFLFTDTFFGKKSIRGYTCMQLFVSDKGFVKVYGMKIKGQFTLALKLFTKEVGVPNAFMLDPSGEQTSNEVRAFCHKIGTTLRILEERTQHADRAELYIGLLKEDVRKELRELHAPMELWCYFAERRAAISNLTSKNLFQLQVQNPHSMALGEPGDVSNLCQFRWYEWCCVSQVKKDFSEPAEDLGR